MNDFDKFQSAPTNDQENVASHKMAKVDSWSQPVMFDSKAAFNKEKDSKRKDAKQGHAYLHLRYMPFQPFYAQHEASIL